MNVSSKNGKCWKVIPRLPSQVSTRLFLLLLFSRPSYPNQFRRCCVSVQLSSLTDDKAVYWAERNQVQLWRTLVGGTRQNPKAPVYDTGSARAACSAQ
jgi:hypothetical protein